MIRIWNIFYVICFLLALYMTLKNIGRFNEDVNATTITYKKYGQTAENKYPSFSLCFEGAGLYRVNKSAIFTAYGLDLRNYELMLDGKPAFQYDYHPSSKGYGKISLPLKFEPITFFEEQDLFQLPDIIKETSFIAGNQIQSMIFGKKYGISAEQMVKEPPLYVSYQEPKLICMTRQQNRPLDLIRNYDTLLLRPSFLDSNIKLKIFIHYPGHLIRSFDSPRFETLLSRVQNKKLGFRISQTTLLRKRSVQNNSCDKKIEDHDRFLLESLSNDAGCVPPYWKNIVRRLTSLRECTTPEQLKKIYDLHKDYKKILENHDTPCLDMFNSITSMKAMHNDMKMCKKCTYIEIAYLEKYYEEIREIKDFGFEDFISGLGGFIGIFLGYSMMQIPQLLGILLMY